MKFILNSIFLSFVMLSCSSSDDSNKDTNSPYPITLEFSGIASNDYTMYKNGVDRPATAEEIESFHTDSSIAFNEDEVATDDKSVFFKFISDNLLETSFSDGDVVTVNYVFDDSFLYAVTPDGEKFLLAQGTKEKLFYRYYAYKYLTGDSSGAGSDSFEDEDNHSDFPATFDTLKDLTEVNSIQEIQGENFLLIQNIASSFEKQD